MNEHETMRDRCSARLDDELHPDLRPELDAHLAGCAACAAYADDLAVVRELAALLPRESAPTRLPERVAARIRTLRRRRTARVVLVPALAAAAVFAGLVAVPRGTPVFPLPDAAAAEPLRRLRTLYAEREIVERAADGRLLATVRERIWYRAPADVRIERTVARDGRTTAQVAVSRPGVRWDGTTVFGNAPPSIELPEPLSPGIAVLGEETGPGPVLAGRPTRRYVLEVGGQRRVAYVDAGTAGVLGGDERVVLGKTGSGGPGTARVEKRTLTVRYDAPIADDRFAVPAGPVVDLGFRDRREVPAAIRPRSLPRGFRLVRAAAAGATATAWYADGALSVLVTTDRNAPRDEPFLTTRPVRVAGRDAVLRLGLYAVPHVTFPVRGASVTLAAPLPPDSLVALAARMFPPE